MLCADCAIASVLPLPLTVLPALDSVQSGSFQLQVLCPPTVSVCSLIWFAVDDELVGPAGWHPTCCLMRTVVVLIL